MCRTVGRITAGLFAGLMVLALAGCGEHSTDTGKQPAARIHGDLITPTAKASQPAQNTATLTAASGPAAVPATAAAQGDFPSVGFDKLASYNFEVPDDGPVTNLTGPDKADEQIPAAVKALDRKKVTLKGFMLPLKVEDGTVTEFLILKDQSMCCYGSVPKITEWVSAKTKSKGIKPIMDMPMSFEGTLHVGAMRENGYLVGIYQMDAEKMVGGN